MMKNDKFVLALLLLGITLNTMHLIAVLKEEKKEEQERREREYRRRKLREKEWEENMDRMLNFIKAERFEKALKEINENTLKEES